MSLLVKLIYGVKVLLVMGLLGGMLSVTSTSVLAVDTTKTNYINNRYYESIISDSDFIAINDYSVNDIQNFLVTQGSFLKDYSQDGRSAAQIIWDASHGHGEASGTLNGIVINSSTGTVNPKAILVTLQKEQSLITRTTYDERAVNCAMGYENGNGCQWMFDNKPNWKGFTNQVEWGSWQLRYNYERAQGRGFSDYQVSQTMSFSCDGVSYPVTLINRATSALYRYTPYVCNGNYNFWKLYTEWFGASTPAPAPAAATNDTSVVEGRTYKGQFVVTGSKTTDSYVFYNNQEVAAPGGTVWRVTITPSVGTHQYTIQYRNSSGGVIATKSVSIDHHKEGDITGDGRVDLLDLSAISGNWGIGVPDGSWINLNPETDNEINILDLSILSSKWEG